jgi:hypothetical protein
MTGVERDLAGLPVVTPPFGFDIFNDKDPTMVAAKKRTEKMIRNLKIRCSFLRGFTKSFTDIIVPCPNVFRLPFATTSLAS